MTLQRWRLLLPALWAGWLLCVALLAAPAPFATLHAADAGRVVARLFAQEAYVALAIGVLLLMLERTAARRAAAAGGGSQFSVGMLLALGTLACTVVGHFVLQPMMVQARAGQGGWTAGQLHAAAVVVFGVKLLLAAALAWRVAGEATRAPATVSPSS